MELFTVFLPNGDVISSINAQCGAVDGGWVYQSNNSCWFQWNVHGQLWMPTSKSKVPKELQAKLLLLT